MIAPDLMTPTAYAARIASYISDPQTIRVRTLEQYGRAPSVDQCAKLRAKVVFERDYGNDARRSRAADPKADFACGHEQTDANTHLLESGREVCAICHRKAERARLAQQREDERQAKRSMFPAWYKPRLITAPVVRPRLHSETLTAVADLMNVSMGELIGDDRHRVYVDARAVAVRVFHVHAGLSYKQISRIMHRDCHSTIRHLHLTWDQRIARNPMLAHVYAQLVQGYLSPTTERA